MGLALGDDDTIRVFQRNREGAGWSWNDKAEPNRFVFDGTGSSMGDAEDAVLILSISGEINEKSIPAILNDPSIPRLRLRANRQGLTSIGREDDWFAFKEQATLASFKIHESYPSVKRVHVFPAMPTSANIAFGMAWNTRLIPELVVYEKPTVSFTKRFDSEIKMESTKTEILNEIMDELASQLNISNTMEDKAVRAYTTIGEWLEAMPRVKT